MARYGVIKAKGIAEALKVTVQQQIESNVNTVIGYLGEGSSKDLQSNWDSPFEGDSAGQNASRVGGGVQTATQGDEQGGLTTVSSFNSTQAWSGNAPMTFNIVMIFKAYDDPKNEVNNAIMALEEMASPELNNSLVGGRTPQSVTLNIGRTNIYTDIVIESVSSELDAPKTKEGYFLENTVTLTLTAKNVINRSKIKSTFKGS
jgi:hypothetical protein